jgi:catechol 2,3-dioxygenase-like lactoylglutathione lyase family enzyme
MVQAITIHQVTPMLHVPNLTEARHFFETILGFTVSFSMEGYFYCERMAAAIRVVEEPTRKPVEQHNARITVYIDCSDVDSLYEELRNGLATLPADYLNPPKNYHWQQREFHVQMPDGNVMAFGQPVPKI